MTCKPMNRQCRNFPRSFRGSGRGFTLLEVMVALTITGMALGGLFGVIAGNKKLAWQSEASLARTMQIRALLNYSQLDDERGDIFIDLQNSDLLLSTGMELEPPERKTQASTLALKQYEVVDEFGEVFSTGTHWVKLVLPE